MASTNRTRAQQELKALVRAKKVSVTALANDLGITQPSVSAWVSGQTRPEAHHRDALERLLGIKAVWWMTDAEYRIAFGRVRAA